MISIQKVDIAHLPTRIEALPRLSSEFADVSLYIKRDDQTGLAFGGNKTRKLEYLIADAKLKKAKTIITAGAAQSNHCRQTAAAAARYGFSCILVLAVNDEEIDKRVSGNLLLDNLFDAEIVWTSFEQREQVLMETFQKAKKEGRAPYLVPYGGSNPIGATSYIFALKELLEQFAENDELPDYPDWIIFPSSSGGTQTGLVIGQRLFNYKGKILGISVDHKAKKLKQHIAKLASETAIFLDLDLSFEPADILVDDNYIGDGYGILSELEVNAVRKFAQKEGILLDPVYTGRAAGGMLDLLKTKSLVVYGKKKTNILFWHTGGTPGLFAEKYAKSFY